MLIFDFVEKGFKKFMQKVIKKAMEKKSFWLCAKGFGLQLFSMNFFASEMQVKSPN
jgi:hypothetical protein